MMGKFAVALCGAQPAWSGRSSARSEASREENSSLRFAGTPGHAGYAVRYTCAACSSVLVTC